MTDYQKFEDQRVLQEIWNNATLVHAVFESLPLKGVVQARPEGWFLGWHDESGYERAREFLGVEESEAERTLLTLAKRSKRNNLHQ